MARSPAALLLLLLVHASGAAAQSLLDDSWTLPRGMLRVGVGLGYAEHDTRFAGDGTEPLAADFLAPLTPAAFVPLRPLEERLIGFLEATGEVAGSGLEDLSLGDPDLEAAADLRTVPLGIAVGILPRVEVGASLPLYRSEVRFTRFGVTGGTVGLNPDPDANAALFGAAGAEFEALGRSPLLPTAGSALGAELARRLEARTGASPALPTEPAGDSVFQALLADSLGLPLGSRTSSWVPGDVEAHVRVRLLGNLGERPYPADTLGFGYRLAATFTLRFPTGREPDTLALLSGFPPLGVGGWGASLAGDVFVGDRLWVAAVSRYTRLGDVDVVRRVEDPGQPFASVEGPRLVRWTPPAQLAVRVSPRFRLVEAIALGAEYEIRRVGDSRFEAGDGTDTGLDVEGGLHQRLGASVRYSTLPAYVEGAPLLAAEVVLAYDAALSGPPGWPADSALRLEARIYPRLWGGLRR